MQRPEECTGAPEAEIAGVWTITWVLGTKVGSSGKVRSDFNL